MYIQFTRMIKAVSVLCCSMFHWNRHPIDLEEKGVCAMLHGHVGGGGNEKVQHIPLLLRIKQQE